MLNTIKVEYVLRGINDRHIGASILYQGKRYPRTPVVDIRKLLSNGAVAENFILKSNGFQGKNCKLDFLYLLTSSEMEKKFHDKWMILIDCTFSDGTIYGSILDGVVYRVFTNEEYARCKHLYSKDVYVHEHTVSGSLMII